MIIVHEKMGMNSHRVHLEPGTFMLFSFDTLVAFKHGDVLYRDEHKYSRTTTKHITQYAGDYTSTELLDHEALIRKVRAFMSLDSIAEFDEELM